MDTMKKMFYGFLTLFCHSDGLLVILCQCAVHLMPTV
jgi:hypothetical protein